MRDEPVIECDAMTRSFVSDVLVFLFSQILDGFVLLFQTRMCGYDVRCMELQGQGVLPER